MPKWTKNLAYFPLLKHRNKVFHSKIYPIIYTGIIIASLVEKILELAYELVQISLKSGFRIF